MGAEKKSKFQVLGANIGRRVLLGPFREGADGRLEIDEEKVEGTGGRRIYEPRSHERALRKKDAELDRHWSGIEEKLRALSEERILTSSRSVYYDFTDAGELRVEWERMLNAASARWPQEKEKVTSISFSRMGELADKYGALIALRDPEGFAKSRLEKRGLLSLIGDYPDLNADFDREMKEEPPPPPPPPPSAPGPGDPEPLERHREIRLEEMPWKNPLPPAPMSAEALAGYWAWALETRSARLEQATKEFPPEEQTGSFRKWLRERWTQVRMLEAILALLHRIVAPEAPYLCGAGCTHLGGGATQEQAKRFLDTLDAFRAIRDYESEENYTAEYARNQFARDLGIRK